MCLGGSCGPFRVLTCVVETKIAFCSPLTLPWINMKLKSVARERTEGKKDGDRRQVEECGLEPRRSWAWSPPFPGSEQSERASPNSAAHSLGLGNSFPESGLGGVALCQPADYLSLQQMCPLPTTSFQVNGPLWSPLPNQCHCKGGSARLWNQKATEMLLSQSAFRRKFCCVLLSCPALVFYRKLIKPWPRIWKLPRQGLVGYCESQEGMCEERLQLDSSLFKSRLAVWEGAWEGRWGKDAFHAPSLLTFPCGFYLLISFHWLSLQSASRLTHFLVKMKCDLKASKICPWKRIQMLPWGALYNPQKAVFSTLSFEECISVAF